jgi:hypothetical protein
MSNVGFREDLAASPDVPSKLTGAAAAPVRGEEPEIEFIPEGEEPENNYQRRVDR